MARLENINGNAIATVTIPPFENVFEVGQELEDGLDLDRLEQSLKVFYDGRLILERDSTVVPVPAPSDPPEVLAPVPKRTRKKS